MKSKGILFPILLGLAAFSIAASAAFFSVFGLAKLFAGATTQVIVMASSLEFGKLVSASFLYRYWDKLNIWLKTYLMVAVLVLVLITSAGIFGYLSNAYQGATLDFETQSTQLQVYQEQVEQLKIDKAFLQDEMKSEIDAMPDNYATAKRKARAGFMEKINPISDRIYELTTTISDLKIGLVESGVDVGPVIFIAQAFETSVDTVVKFFIFILIFVFDPLAITLVVAANMVLLDYAQALYEASPKPKKSFWDKFKWKKKESMYGDESYEKLKLGDDDIEYSKGTYGHPVIEPPLVEIKDKVNPSDEFINKAGLKP